MNKQILWYLGVPALIGLYGLEKGKAEALVQGWGKEYPPEAVLMALTALSNEHPPDPVSYMEEALSAAPVAVKPPKVYDGSKWGMRMKGWDEKRFWILSFGPKPGESGCQVPSEYLEQ
jgi:hypothetical protein